MKPLLRVLVGAGVLAAGTSFVASAQSVISAKSGLVHYVEGRVYVNDQLVESKFGNFPDVKENSQLRTEEGRAEMLLTPGVFLRVSENSAIRMMTNRLIDTRVEFLSGSALVEAGDLLKDNHVAVVYKDYIINLEKKGIYRFDAEPGALRVYEGEAVAERDGKTVEVKGGHMLAFDGDLTLAKFDAKDLDQLYRWSVRRSEYLAMANVSAAKSVRDSGMYWGSNRWYWNPYFNMYTFVPSSGMYFSPFGFAFWSPFTVYNYLYSPVIYGGRGGYGGSRGGGPVTTTTRVPATSTGRSGTVASSSTSVRSPSTAASGSMSGAISRGGGNGGRRPH